MTIFNSQPVNTDPKPWTTNPGQEIGYRTEEQPWFSERNFFYDPRPEYDNNVNPVLYAFRTSVMNSDMGVSGIADSWLWLLALGEKFFGEHAEDAGHATKVLRRLSFLGYTEDTTATEGENNGRTS